MKTTLYEFKINNSTTKSISSECLGTKSILMVGSIESSITEGFGTQKEVKEHKKRLLMSKSCLQDD